MPPTNYSRAPRHHGPKTVQPLAIQRLALNGSAVPVMHHPTKMRYMTRSTAPVKIGMGPTRHSLSGPHHHHGGHGGGRGFIPPFAYGYGYPESSVVYPDPCLSPALYPPGTCAAIMGGAQGPLSGASCCDSCASGGQCSGLGGIADLPNIVIGTVKSHPIAAAAAAYLAYLAYRRLKR